MLQNNTTSMDLMSLLWIVNYVFIHFNYIGIGISEYITELTVLLWKNCYGLYE